MKKWTVMLIPHDLGNTRTFTLTNWHSRITIALLAGLVFTTSCLFQYNRLVMQKANRLSQENWMLQVQGDKTVEAAAPQALSEQQIREIEERTRAEYEASLAAITAELGDLYDMEAKARNITGLAHRPVKAADRFSESIGAAAKNTAKGGGKGGPSVGFEAPMDAHDGRAFHLPNVIYGVSRPSADLILQEIRLRTRSFGDLVHDMEVAREKVDRRPSIWPVAGGAGRKTSGFGYRRDPFNGRLRQHNGTDISARVGTRIKAAAKGKVVESTFDRDYGNVVIIDHGNGIRTLYAHMSQRTVRPGQVVERGDAIGALGSTGRSTGPHLHYEVHVNRKPVDPEKYLTE